MATDAGRICVSLRAHGPEDGLRALAALEAEGVELIELRLDDWRAEVAAVRTLFGGRARRVATCRPGGTAGPRRAALLEEALGAGAAFVDVELEAEPGLQAGLVARARALGRRVIVSFHDHAGTPAGPELGALREACFAAGADIAKLACTPRAAREAARLLGLLDDPRPVVVAGMGPWGRPVRLLAPLLGAPFTYASAGEGLETAPGQLPHARLRRLLEEVEGA